MFGDTDSASGWVCVFFLPPWRFSAIKMEDIISFVENRVRRELEAFGVDFSSRTTIGAAVSGGADSIALLTALSRLLPENCTLKVITVNHNIRAAEETEGDASFVQEYCRKLGVQCARHDVVRGTVEKIALERGLGIEEAARNVRYEAFETFIRCSSVSCLCLAHNKNDQIETVLMRFLSGGDSSSLSGIPKKRDKYLRPLLSVSRSEIESYLSVQGIPYRTDSTNSDTSLLRNRIRNHLMPLLDTEFPGWNNAVWSLSQKMHDDAAAVDFLSDSALETIAWKDEDEGISFDRYFFSVQQSAVKRRLLYRAFTAAGPSSRVPYGLIERVIGLSSSSGWHEEASGIEVFCKDARIFVQKARKLATESGFFVIIEKDGMYPVGDCILSVSRCGSDMVLSSQKKGFPKSVISLAGLGFPFVCRSRQSDDSIKSADGSMKSVSKILEDWKCGSMKDDVPVIQNVGVPGQPLVCLWGSLLGFRNWIVKG